MTTSKNNMIDVVAVSRHFGPSAVVKRVSFSVQKGQSYVILGQSGAGKSVLLKMLAGLIQPDEGHIRIQTQNIGMLFQKNALFDSMTVQENLDFPLRETMMISSKDRRKKIDAYLENVGLPGTNLLSVNELSGGMQKRLGIARALIIEPEVILYDEPTAGLDPITSRIIVDLIVQLQKKMKTTVVCVTSDVMRAFQQAHQLGLLIRAQTGSYLLETGTPDQTKQSQDPSVQQFIKGITKGPLTSGLDDQTVSLSKKSFFEMCVELENDPF